MKDLRPYLFFLISMLFFQNNISCLKGIRKNPKQFPEKPKKNEKNNLLNRKIKKNKRFYSINSDSESYGLKNIELKKGDFDSKIKKDLDLNEVKVNNNFGVDSNIKFDNKMKKKSNQNLINKNTHDSPIFKNNNVLENQKMFPKNFDDVKNKNKPIAKINSSSKKESIEGSIEESIEEQIEESNAESIEESIEEPIEEPIQESIEESIEEPIQELIDNRLSKTKISDNLNSSNKIKKQKTSKSISKEEGEIKIIPNLKNSLSSKLFLNNKFLEKNKENSFYPETSIPVKSIKNKISSFENYNTFPAISSSQNSKKKFSNSLIQKTQKSKFSESEDSFEEIHQKKEKEFSKDENRQKNIEFDSDYTINFDDYDSTISTDLSSNKIDPNEINKKVEIDKNLNSILDYSQPLNKKMKENSIFKEVPKKISDESISLRLSKSNSLENNKELDYLKINSISKKDDKKKLKESYSSLESTEIKKNDSKIFKEKNSKKNNKSIILFNSNSNEDFKISDINQNDKSRSSEKKNLSLSKSVSFEDNSLEIDENNLKKKIVSFKVNPLKSKKIDKKYKNRTSKKKKLSKSKIKNIIPLKDIPKKKQNEKEISVSNIEDKKQNEKEISLSNIEDKKQNEKEISVSKIEDKKQNKKELEKINLFENFHKPSKESTDWQNVNEYKEKINKRSYGNLENPFKIKSEFIYNLLLNNIPINNNTNIIKKKEKKEVKEIDEPKENYENKCVNSFISIFSDSDSFFSWNSFYVFKKAKISKKQDFCLKTTSCCSLTQKNIMLANLGKDIQDEMQNLNHLIEFLILLIEIKNQKDFYKPFENNLNDCLYSQIKVFYQIIDDLIKEENKIIFFYKEYIKRMLRKSLDVFCALCNPSNTLNFHFSGNSNKYFLNVDYNSEFFQFYETLNYFAKFRNFLKLDKIFYCIENTKTDNFLYFKNSEFLEEIEENFDKKFDYIKNTEKFRSYFNDNYMPGFHFKINFENLKQVFSRIFLKKKFIFSKSSILLKYIPLKTKKLFFTDFNNFTTNLSKKENGFNLKDNLGSESLKEYIDEKIDIPYQINKHHFINLDYEVTKKIKLKAVDKLKIFVKELFENNNYLKKKNFDFIFFTFSVCFFLF